MPKFDGFFAVLCGMILVTIYLLMLAFVPELSMIFVMAITLILSIVLWASTLIHYYRGKIGKWQALIQFCLGTTGLFIFFLELSKSPLANSVMR